MTCHETMLHDHDRLDALLAGMIDAALAGDREDLGARWDAFEVVLLAHIDGEEMFMLPALARHDAKRAAAIHADHTRIRELLAQIAVGLDLHLVRDTHMVELRKLLEAHARGEEVDFYRWADASLPETTHRSIRRRIEDRFKAVVAAAGGRSDRA